MQCSVCDYKDNCKLSVEEPLLCGCSSGHPVEFVNTKTEWVRCPVCGGKTRTKIRQDTEAKNFPIFCKICKNEFLMNIKGLKCEVVKSERIH